MKVEQYKNHLRDVIKRLKKVTDPPKTVVVGFNKPIEKYRIIGYLHKTRLHKTNTVLSDYSFVRYMFPGGDGTHYAEAEMCVLRGRKTQQVFNKVLIIREL